MAVRDRLERTAERRMGTLAARGAEWLIRALLGAVLATGRVMADAAPFGVALVAASGVGGQGLAALLGAAFGYLAGRGAESGLRYTAAAILVFSVSFALYDLSVYRRTWTMPVAAALIIGLTGFITRPVGSWTAAEISCLAAEMALTALAVYAFRRAFALWEGPGDRQEATARQRFCLMFLGIATLVSLAELTVLDLISVGRLAACMVTLWAAWTAGPGAGAAVGVAAGLAMDLSLSGGSFCAMTYAVAGLTAGLLKRDRRVWSALGFVTAVALTALWDREAAPGGVLWEAAAAGVLLLVLPRGLLTRLRPLLIPPPQPDGAAWAAQVAARRLRDAAGAFTEVFAALKGLFQRPDDPPERPGVILDRAANRVCVGCALRDRCWLTDYQDTHDQLAGALNTLLTADTVMPQHFPQRFRDRCTRFPVFSEAVAEELAAYRLRRRYTAEVDRSRRAVCTQYGDMARVLSDAAEAMAAPLVQDTKRTAKLTQLLNERELAGRGVVFLDDRGRAQIQLEGDAARALEGEAGREALSRALDLPLGFPRWTGDALLLRQREPLTAVAGVAGRRREGEEVTGDAGSWFKDDRGQVFLLLCDGMGSGLQARQDSRLTLRLLEKFLRAGITAENALKTVNQALLLRGEETGSFSTIDLLTLDLYTGQGVLYKLGAAPSYLKRGGTVSRLAGSALPAGVTDDAYSKPDRAAFQVAPGDCVVLLTDGAAPDGNDAWLTDQLRAFDGGSPTALAEALVAHAAPTDDRTALVLKIGLREEVSAATQA